MTFDAAAPVLTLIIDPGDTTATLRPMRANESGMIARVIEGPIEAVEIDGGSVLWLHESGKDIGLATSLLATQIAHRLNAGLLPDDTINGRALIIGEAIGPDGELVCVDVTSATLQAIHAVGVSVVSG